MREIASEKILQGIIDNDSKVIQYIYNEYFESIKSFVVKNNGTKEDAWDIFQDGIVVIYEQIKNDKLALKNTFHTYFFTVCKFNWLKILRERDKKYYEQIETSNEVERISLYDYKLDLDEIIEKEKRIKLYDANFLKISKECQKFLKLIAEGNSIQEIASSFDYKSVGFAYKKQSMCKERLIKLIQKDLSTLKTKNK